MTSEPTGAPAIGDIVWYRKEYLHRKDELINATDIARFAAVSRSTVDGWRAKYRATFPEAVMAVITIAGNAAYYYAAGEIARWLVEERPGPQRATEAERLGTVADDLDFEIEEAEARARHLRAVREQILLVCEGAVVR